MFLMFMLVRVKSVTALLRLQMAYLVVLYKRSADTPTLPFYVLSESANCGTMPSNWENFYVISVHKRDSDVTGTNHRSVTLRL